MLGRQSDFNEERSQPVTQMRVVAPQQQIASAQSLHKVLQACSSDRRPREFSASLPVGKQSLPAGVQEANMLRSFLPQSQRRVQGQAFRRRCETGYVSPPRQTQPGPALDDSRQFGAFRES